MLNYKLLIISLIIFIIGSCASENETLLSGKELYTKKCVACHGVDGTKGLAKAADLSVSTLSTKEQKHIIKEGKGMMAPFKHALNENQIDSLVVYIQELKN